MGLVFLFACLICLSLHSTFSRLAPLLDFIELFGRSEIKPFNVCVIEFSLTDTEPSQTRVDPRVELANKFSDFIDRIRGYVDTWDSG
jgi:hypothetical protein